MNARSILNKSEAVESLLLCIKPDFLAITETWLTHDVMNFEITPPGYVIVRKDRTTRGGGVAILINKKIPYTVMPEAFDVEAIFCKLMFGSCNVIVGCVYLSPNSGTDSLQALHGYMQRHVAGARVILLGDFNLPTINWETLRFPCARSEILFDLMLSFNLSQIVKEPTRVQGTKSNILDLIFTSNHFPTHDSKIEIMTGISDHKLVLCTSHIQRSKTDSVSRTTFADFANADDTTIIDYLSFQLDSFVNASDHPSADIDTVWQLFKNIVLHCLHNYVPVKTKRTNKHNPWMTRDVIHAKRRVKRLRKSLKHKPNLSRNSLCTAIVEMKSKIKMAKCHYFKNVLPSFIQNAPKKFWDYLNPKKRTDKSTTGTNRTTAESLNTYFTSVFTIDDGKIPHTDSCDENHLEPVSVTEAGVLNLLLSLDIKKSPGPDKIPNQFLRRYAEWIAKYLYVIFNKSLLTGTVPKEWKKAKIIPIPKCDNTNDESNYRPISLTCTLCKILEHIILKHLTTYLEQKRFLSPSQHGFRRGLSTVTQLAELIHDLSSSIDNQKQVDLILLDFSKAFDRVSHEKLIKKVQSAIGNCSVVRWIKNYLSDRTQYVEINNETSSIATVTSGVPQGSVLAPLLFLIFINDLPLNIPVTVKLFADDCILYNEINSHEDHVALNNALETVSKWCADWQMTINAKKSALLTITRKKTGLISPTPLITFPCHEFTNINTSA